MKVLAIVGSPRRSGNLVQMSKKVLEGAAQKGHAVEILNLYNYDVKDCLGCWRCAQEKSCHIQDDFSGIMEKFREADVIVLASPVYWGTVSGKMKTFMDRHIGDVMMKPEHADDFRNYSKREKIKTMFYFASHFGPLDEYKNKKFILLTTCTVPKLIGYLMGDLRHTLGVMKIYVHNLKGKVIGKIIYADTLFQLRKNAKDAAMKKAYRIGARL